MPDKTISAVEVSRERPSRDLVIAIESALGLPPETLVDLYELLDVESLPRWMRDWVLEEAKAGSLRSYQLAIFPGLLQTEAYTRALLNGDEAAVQARMERQSILTRDAPPTLRAVIDEGVLYRDKGGPTVMREQLMHLAESISEKIAVQVVRSNVSPGLSGAFAIATVDGRKVGYIETVVRGIVTSSPDDIDCLEEEWETIRTHALSQQESLDLIQKVAEEKWT